MAPSNGAAHRSHEKHLLQRCVKGRKLARLPPSKMNGLLDIMSYMSHTS